LFVVVVVVVLIVRLAKNTDQRRWVTNTFYTYFFVCQLFDFEDVFVLVSGDQQQVGIRQKSVVSVLSEQLSVPSGERREEEEEERRSSWLTSANLSPTNREEEPVLF